MSTDILLYLAAFGGGFLGATFGALIAFAFTGITLLIGIAILVGTGGDATFISEVAFGPYFGPHISFAGGVAAAAFAGKKGWLDSGNNTAKPLVSLAKPLVLVVGGLFGVLGAVIVQIIGLIPWFGSHTDAVALTVVTSGIIARLAFGKTGILGANSEGLTGMARFRTNETQVWVPYQSKWSMAGGLGLGVGLISAYAAVTLVQKFPDSGNVILLGFGISAASLLFLLAGLAVPVTHHMTIIAAIAAANFLPITGSPVAAVAIGAVFGGLAGLAGEAFSRLWNNRGDSQIDPPASAIWPMTTVVLGLAALFG